MENFYYIGVGMKLSLVSDLHVDFDKAIQLELPGGETLLLAGDLCEVDYLSTVKPRLMAQLSKYDQIIAVLGNHEHYNYNFEETFKRYQQILPEVELLENSWTQLSSEVILFGATLWSDLDKGNPLVEMNTRNWSDYKHIRVGGRKLRSQDTLLAHKTSIAALYACLEAFPDKKVIIMTHFLPSKKSVHPRYDMSLDNWFFYSELEDIILNNPNIVVWCHGHTHDTFDYMIGDCRVICNPRGYVTSYKTEATGWNPNFTFEI